MGVNQFQKVEYLRKDIEGFGYEGCSNFTIVHIFNINKILPYENHSSIFDDIHLSLIVVDG